MKRWLKWLGLGALLFADAIGDDVKRAREMAERLAALPKPMWYS